MKEKRSGTPSSAVRHPSFQPPPLLQKEVDCIHAPQVAANGTGEVAPQLTRLAALLSVLLVLLQRQRQSADNIDGRLLQKHLAGDDQRRGAIVPDRRCVGSMGAAAGGGERMRCAVFTHCILLLFRLRRLHSFSSRWILFTAACSCSRMILSPTACCSFCAHTKPSATCSSHVSTPRSRREPCARVRSCLSSQLVSSCVVFLLLCCSLRSSQCARCFRFRASARYVSPR